MKILITALIAGLLLSLSISAQAGSTKMECTFGVGENLQTKSIYVSNPEMTSMDFSSGGIVFTATAIYDSMNVYAKFNNVTFGNSGENRASIDVYTSNGEPVSLKCYLYRIRG